jgi:hypothetical protein
MVGAALYHRAPTAWVLAGIIDITLKVGYACVRARCVETASL